MHPTFHCRNSGHNECSPEIRRYIVWRNNLVNAYQKYHIKSHKVMFSSLWFLGPFIPQTDEVTSDIKTFLKFYQVIRTAFSFQPNTTTAAQSTAQLFSSVLSKKKELISEISCRLITRRLRSVGK